MSDINPFLTICIPSYNRPRELLRLLESIDCDPEQIEILVCEDHSPKRDAIAAIVSKFAAASSYTLRYHENEKNLGFDGNIRNLVASARGKFIIFMGDDDLFIKGALDQFIDFLYRHQEYPYVLRSYIAIHENGTVEKFRYLPETTVIPAGENSVAWLFKRSVSLSGFTILRESANKVSTSDLDGTLLYQVYLMSETCLSNDSVFCEFPVTQAWQTFRDDYQMFGNSEAERSRFKPGAVSEDNSINFTMAYFEVAAYLDKKHGTSLEDKIRLQISKYSYPFLSIQRKKGISHFLHYAHRLESDLGLGISGYFHCYKWGLVLFGERLCDRLIILVKRLIGHTPDL